MNESAYSGPRRFVVRPGGQWLDGLRLPAVNLTKKQAVQIERVLMAKEAKGFASDFARRLWPRVCGRPRE